MVETHQDVAADIARIDERLSDPEERFEDLRADLPWLGSASEARRFLEEVREGLIDCLEGRIVSHEDVRREVEERRRRYSSAAE